MQDRARNTTGKPTHSPPAGRRDEPALLTPDAGILHMQQMVGNQAVQRLLAKADLENATRQVPHLQRQVSPPVHLPRSLQSQDVVSTTIGTPQITQFGGFIWDADFRLPSPAAGDGYIIQECWHNAQNLVTGAPTRPEWHYFEWWRVAAGAVGPVDRVGPSHDTFAYHNGTEEGPHMRYSIRGVARFYETPVYPWGIHHPSNIPGANASLIDSPSPPPIWTGQGLNREAVSVYDARNPAAPVTSLEITNGGTVTRFTG
jgi:hypothetical protein